MTRNWAAFTAGVACGLFVLGYLAEKLLASQLKSPVAPSISPLRGLGLAQRTHGSIVGGTRSERSKWFTDEPWT